MGKDTLLVIIKGNRKKRTNNTSSALFPLHTYEKESSIEGPTRQANAQEGFLNLATAVEREKAV